MRALGVLTTFKTLRHKGKTLEEEYRTLISIRDTLKNLLLLVGQVVVECHMSCGNSKTLYLFDLVSLHKLHVVPLGRLVLWITESGKLDDIIARVTHNLFIPHLPFPNLFSIYLSSIIRGRSSFNKSVCIVRLRDRPIH
jgi:hypothetical protein